MGPKGVKLSPFGLNLQYWSSGYKIKFVDAQNLRYADLKFRVKLSIYKI